MTEDDIERIFFPTTERMDRMQPDPAEPPVVLPKGGPVTRVAKVAYNDAKGREIATVNEGRKFVAAAFAPLDQNGAAALALALLDHLTAPGAALECDRYKVQAVVTALVNFLSIPF